MQESTITIVISVLANAAYLWLPVKVSYIFVGKSKLQRVQSRIAYLLTLAYFLNIALLNTIYSYPIFLIGGLNWALMVRCIAKRDFEKDNSK